jgi:hypothetical protein
LVARLLWEQDAAGSNPVIPILWIFDGGCIPLTQQSCKWKHYSIQAGYNLFAEQLYKNL